jgi:hypothetical protein
MKTSVTTFFLVLALAGCDNSASRTTGSAPPSADDVSRRRDGQDTIVQHPKIDIGSPEANSQELVAIEPKSVKPPRKEEEEEPSTVVQKDGEEKELPPEKDPPLPEGLKPLNKEKTLFFEKTQDDKRRVYILAEVCLRQGPLEVFLCNGNEKRSTKEHESILHADLDPRDIHFALIAAGAKPGSTVRFTPKYKPATGDIIKVTVIYHMDGKLMTKPAQYWIQDIKTKGDMPHDWVFAGSRFFKDPEDPQKPPYYCANNGEVICISNFPDSMLDLPVMSSKEEAELEFKAHTSRIPPVKTKVLVRLEVRKKG